MKQKTAYKVVDVVNGKLVSSSETGIMRKTYYINKYVNRNKKYGPLCLFRTLKAARQYCKNMSNVDAGLRFRIYKAGLRFRIYKVEYKGSKDVEFILPWGSITFERMFEMKSIGPLWHVPKKEFLLAESVKLLKEMPR